MSETIAIIKQMYAAFAQGDVPGILAHIADDVVWESEGPSSLKFYGICHGPAEVASKFFAGIAEEHGNPVLNMTEFIASGDSVATFGRYQATIKETRVDTPVAHLWQFRDGKVVRFLNFGNTAAFAEAAK